MQYPSMRLSITILNWTWWKGSAISEGAEGVKESRLMHWCSWSEVSLSGNIVALILFFLQYLDGAIARPIEQISYNYIIIAAFSNFRV